VQDVTSETPVDSSQRGQPNETPVDFSQRGEPKKDAARGPESQRYDPEPQREKLRGWIAVGLVVLFALAIAVSFFLFWWFGNKTDAQKEFLSALKDFLPLVLTPLTSVVSAVVGFYYGAQTRRGD